MKKTAVLAIAMSVCLWASATDYNREMKGEVTSVSTSSYGSLNSSYTTVDKTYLEYYFRNSSSYYRNNETNSDYNRSFPSSEVDGGHNLSYTITRDESGNVKTLKQTDSWTESESYAVSNDCSVWLKQAKAALARGNYRSYEENMYKYSNCPGVVYKERSVKRSSTSTMTVKRSVVDPFGNWLYQEVDIDGDEYTRLREITYNKEWWSKKVWAEVSKRNDWESVCYLIENSDKVSGSVMAQVGTYWNNHIMEHVAKDGYKEADLLAVIKADCATSANRDSAYSMLRRQEYERVLQETDFSRVNEMAGLKKDGVEVFDQPYRSMIINRAEQLRRDSVAELARQMEQARQQNNPRYSRSCASRLLNIDPYNMQAKAVLQEAEYLEIAELQGNGMDSEEMYDDFLEKYPNTPYYADLQNAKALAAARALTTESSNKEIERVDNLPCDQKTARAVNKTCKQVLNQRNGEVLSLGSALELGFGANMQFEWNLHLKAGANGHPVNGIFGLGIGALMPIKDSQDPDMMSLLLTIPLGLRFNLYSDYYNQTAWYMEAGCPLQIRVTSKFAKETIREITPVFNAQPRFGVGYAGILLDVQLYAGYELFSPFCGDYIRDNVVYEDYNGNTTPVVDEMSDNMIKHQINDSFWNRFQIGVRFAVDLGL